MQGLLQDLRYGLRTLIKSPGFTAVALIALALGIGANTAIFSVINAVLLRPLPYKQPEKLAVLWGTTTIDGEVVGLPVAAGNFLDWQAQNQVFDYMAAFQSQSLNMTGNDEPERVGGVRASASLFPLLGVEPMLGRTFSPEEDRPDATRVVVLSHGFWQRRFAGDANVVGQTITLEGNVYTVIGVMPSGFQFPRRNDFPPGYQFSPTIDLWLPVAFTPAQTQNRGRQYLAVIGRLKPGITIEQAQEDMNGIAARLEEQYPQSNTDQGVTVASLHKQIVSNVRPALLALLGAVAFVLLIACANVANLSLVRATVREREIAVRSALGAGRMRIVRQLVTESVMLAVVGGALGFLLALWGVDVLLAMAPRNIPRFDDVTIDGRVLGFTLLVSLTTGILFGLVPAFHSSRIDLNESLKEGGARSGGSLRRNRLRSVLVVTEVALALVLLVGAGLMVRSFQRLVAIDPGFKVENILTMEVNLSRSTSPDANRRAAFFEQALDKIKGVPGVQAAAGIYPLPLGGAEEGAAFSIEGEPPPAPGEIRSAGPRYVTSDYFAVMSIPLKKGRFFDLRDWADSRRVVIIDEALAQRYFPDQDPIGRRLSFFSPNDWREIVGIVGNVKHTRLEIEARPQLYAPYSQFPILQLTFVVKTSGDPTALAGAIRREIGTVDKDQPITKIRAMEELLADALAQRRFNLMLFGVFASVALALATVGIYGVMAYAVTQRTREIGVRMALGAGRGDVLRMVMRHGLALGLMGIGGGLGGAIALTRVLSGLLYGVSATDPITFVAISALLAGVCVLASYVPARRAAKVDPMVALRYE